MEERNGEILTEHRIRESVETKLLRIAGKAGKEPAIQFNNLYHLMSEEHLTQCFKALKGDAASGIDRVTKEDYAEKLEENISNLTKKLHNMGYIPQPVRRVYIPKPGSTKQRPLGIPVLEDKIVQMGLSRIVEAIYEQDFIGDSYGFRCGRNCHQALRELSRTVERNPVNYIVEADIKGFFDNVSHEWMMKFVGHRISDKKILRMVKRFLKSGISEDGKRTETDKGTPQGGIISPVLANIYLHYVLDEWFERAYKRKCNGYARMIRYADDFVVCFQYEAEAVRFREELTERLNKFGLEAEPTKTKVILFGRYAEERARKKGVEPATFDFLGFTHYGGVARSGKRFIVKRKTAKKKFNAKIKAFTEWIKGARTLRFKTIIEYLKRLFRGYFAYYGVTHNFKMINRFAFRVRAILLKWLNRRGGKRKMSWEKLINLLNIHQVPKPKIVVNLY